MRDADGKGSTYFLGSGSGIYFIRSVLSILARNSTTQQPLSPEEELVPGEDDRLQNQGQSKSLWRSHEVVEQTDNTPIPSFDSLVDWSRSYFETWHRAFPFLHAPSVLHSFNRICDGDIRNIDPVEAIIVRSIMSICIHDRRQKIPQTDAHVPSGLVFATVQDALAALQVALCRPTSIAILQAVVAVQVFLMSMLHYNSASRIGGLLVRMAHQLGLHRCPARFSRFSVEEVGIRRRLWWSIYCFERHLAQSLGLPLDIRDDDVDVCYPGREEHSQEKENGVQDERLWLLTSLAKHAKLRGLILELRNKSIRYRQENSDQAVLIHAELSKWWNEVQDMWDIESDHLEVQEEAENEKQPRLLETHRILIGVLKQELIISLNRPLLASKAGNNSYAAALQNCIGASQQIISILRKSLARKSAGSDALPAWPSLTSAVWMSCFVLIYAAVEGNFPVKSALRFVNLSLLTSLIR